MYADAHIDLVAQPREADYWAIQKEKGITLDERERICFDLTNALAHNMGAELEKNIRR